MVGSQITEVGHLRDVDLVADPVEDPDDGLVLKDGVVRRGNAPGGGGGGEASGAHAETVGDGSEVTFDITHGLGTRNIGGLAAWDVTTDPEERLAPAWLIVDNNTVRVTFSSAPDTDGVRVVVLTAGGETGGGGGGGSGIWEHIATQEVSGGTIDVTGIDADYTAFRLLLRWSGGGGNTFAVMRLNGDSGSSSYQIDRPTGGTQTRSEMVFYFSSADAGSHAGQMAGTITQPSATAHALFGTERVAHGNPQESAWGTGRWVNPSNQKINRITILTTVGSLGSGSKLILEGTRE